MIVGLLFAVQDAEDSGGGLAATLPFAGSTLLEYQGRLLVACGASQLLIVTGRLTAGLVGAVGRLGDGRVVVDAVRDADEAAAKIHPLSRLLVLADGLVTSEAVLETLGSEGPDALLVSDRGHELERLSGAIRWAGVARLSPAHVDRVAELPRDYDFEASLIRVAAQEGVALLALPGGAEGTVHAIERRADALDARTRAIVDAATRARSAWLDRGVVAPLAKLVLPRILRRHIGTPWIVAGAAGSYMLGLLALADGPVAVGVATCLGGSLMLGVAAVAAHLRRQDVIARALRRAEQLAPLTALGATGATLFPSAGVVAPVLALSTILFILLGESAARSMRRVPAWGSPAAYLVPVAVASMLGYPLSGLGLAGAYAAGTAFAAVEVLRGR